MKNIYMFIILVFNHTMLNIWFIQLFNLHIISPKHREYPKKSLLSFLIKLPDENMQDSIKTIIIFIFGNRKDCLNYWTKDKKQIKQK